MSHLGETRPDRLVGIEMFEAVVAQRDKARAKAHEMTMWYEAEHENHLKALDRVAKLEGAIRTALGETYPLMPLPLREILMEGMRP